MNKKIPEKQILTFLVQHKLLFISLFIIWAFTYIIRNDYVAADAYIAPSDNYCYVTVNDPLSVSISPVGNKIRSVLLSITYPDSCSETIETVISLLENNTEITNFTMKGTDYYEMVGSLENTVDFTFEDIIEVNSESEYSILITSNAQTAESAFGFRLDTSHQLWTRPTYLILTTSERKLLCFLIASFITCVAYTICYHKKMSRLHKPENFFLATSLFLSFLYLFCVPIFQVPDEVNHYVRAFGIAHGYFLTPSDGHLPIPQNLIPYEWNTYTPFILLKYFNMEIDSANAILHNNVNMSLYSPISYVFQVLGIRIADTLCNNTYLLVLAGSIFNIAGCTTLIYFAIKYIPYGKGIVTFISLLPMALQERASLSVDAITYAIAVTMLAFCLYMREQKKQMTKLQLLIMYLLIFFTTSCKVVYFIAAFMIVIIPKECFKTKKAQWIHKGAGTLLIFLNSFGWLAIAGSYLNNTRGGGSASEKIQFILNNMGRYIYIIDKTFWELGEGFLYEMLGYELGSLNIVINSMLIIMITLMFCKIYYYEKNLRRLPDYTASIWMILLSAGMLLLIATSLYIQWTDFAASTYSIEGIQGRYFLPVLPFFLCAFLSQKSKTAFDNFCLTKPAFALFVLNLLTLMNVLADSSFVD